LLKIKFLSITFEIVTVSCWK